ncbi:MAG TPA: HAD hydrolase family protein [Anaerolineae bacterium]|nr:HAD hydrolase family protein [Anaerolineae bacterium]
MIEIEIPGRGELKLSHVVLDVNGTLAVDGRLIANVSDRLAALRAQLTLHLLTADTHVRQSTIDTALRLKAYRLTPGDERRQKAAFVEQLGAAEVVAIGNGANDAGMLETAALSIAVIGCEGVSSEAIAAADIIVTSISDALDLLLLPKRLIATLRR